VFQRIVVTQSGDAGKRPGVIDLVRDGRGGAPNGAVHRKTAPAGEFGGRKRVGVAAGGRDDHALEANARRVVVLIVEDEVNDRALARQPTERWAERKGVAAVERGAVDEVFLNTV